MTWWSAPVADGPVTGRVRVPGSKSASNRALVLAVLSDGPSVLHGVLNARDTQLMVSALADLGHLLETSPDPATGNMTVHVEPRPMQATGTIECGLAGTVMRFVPPVAALNTGRITFDGDETARARPMGTLLGALRELGVEIDDGGYDTLPFTILGRGAVPGGAVTIDASRSSQFVSGLLLSAARFDAGITIRHVGERVPSTPHIEMTIAMLADHGVLVQRAGTTTWHVEPQHIAARDVQIEPDLSNATPFLAAAMATQGSVTVADWPEVTTQPGAAILPILEHMGGRWTRSNTDITVHGPQAIRGIDVDLADVGELTPTVAALASLAESPSTLTGIAHLRGHETDRIAALATELSKVGAHVEELPDGLRIEPGPPQAADLATYQDHRMATAAAIVGLRIPGVRVADIGTTSKTLPDFPGMWSALVSGA